MMRAIAQVATSSCNYMQSCNHATHQIYMILLVLVFFVVYCFTSLTILLSTFFCLIMILTRCDIAQGSMNVFILYFQAVSTYVHIFPSTFYRFRPQTFFVSFYGLWNLDFFRAIYNYYILPPFCISPRMNTLQVVSLDYVVALYPLCFTAVLIV